MARFSGSQTRPRTSTGDLFNLPELQFDRRRPAEDRYCNLETCPLLVDFLDMPLERSERPIRHLDGLTDLEGDRRLRTLYTFPHLAEDPHRLFLRDRHRLPFSTEEACHLWCVLDQDERRVRHLHLYKHITRQELALGLHLATALDFDDLFRRHQHFFEQILKPSRLRALLDGVSHLPLK